MLCYRKCIAQAVNTNHTTYNERDLPKAHETASGGEWLAGRIANWRFERF